jgi:hypothetical protein
MSMQQAHIWNSLFESVGQLDQNQWQGKPFGTDKQAMQSLVFFEL